MIVQTVILKNKILAFTQNDILNKLPENILLEIKKKDEHPFFSMYSMAHEGVSTPNLIGEKARPIKWGRAAIQSIKNIISKGVKLFRGHNTDNSTDGRKELGEVVHSFQDEMDGKLHHMVIAYHPEEVREEIKALDVCSQEAEWNFIEKAGELIATTIDKLTGIALADSKKEQPAFSGAKRMAMVQAFENKGEKMSETREVTFHDVQKFIRDNKVFAWQLYTEDDLMDDRKFGNIFKEHGELKSKNAEYEKKLPKLEDEIKNLTKQNNLNTAKSRLDNIFESQPQPDKIKDFVYKTFDKQKEKINDLSDDGLKDFVEMQKDYFQTMASLVNPDFKPTDNQKDEKDETVDGKDFTKAENNEFLDEDL
jgi:hypothetical protein